MDAEAIEAVPASLQQYPRELVVCTSRCRIHRQACRAASGHPADSPGRSFPPLDATEWRWSGLCWMCSRTSSPKSSANTVTTPIRRTPSNESTKRTPGRIGTCWPMRVGPVGVRCRHRGRPRLEYPFRLRWAGVPSHLVERLGRESQFAGRQPVHKGGEAGKCV